MTKKGTIPLAIKKTILKFGAYIVIFYGLLVTFLCDKFSVALPLIFSFRSPPAFD